MNTVKFHALEGATPPTRGTEQSAGWDLYSRETYEIRPGDLCLVDTGIIARPPDGYHFKAVIRSSGAVKKGLTLANGFGVIDQDYCGPNDILFLPIFRMPITQRNWGGQRPKVVVGYSSREFVEQVKNTKVRHMNWYSKWDTKPLIIRKGDRVAQLLIEKTEPMVWERQESRDFAKEDRGGFGSTGE